MPSEQRAVGIRDFNLPPAIGGTNEGPQAIEDFRVVDEETGSDINTQSRRKKPNLAAAAEDPLA